jgi:hypothetical protein
LQKRRRYHYGRSYEGGFYSFSLIPSYECRPATIMGNREKGVLFHDCTVQVLLIFLDS